MGWVDMIGITFGSFLSGVFFMVQGLWKCVECRYTPSLRFFSVFSSGVAKKKKRSGNRAVFSAIATDGHYEKYCNELNDVII